jgi:hypothetical protein
MDRFSGGGGIPFGVSATTTTMMSTRDSTASIPSDEYWRDDFRPLRDAGKAILSVLRRDETSTHGDLYRRIISTSSSSNASTNGDSELNPAHHYFYPSNGVSSSSSSSSSSNSFPGTDTASNWESESMGSTVQHMGTIPLPPDLEEKRKKVRVSTMMGLFPQGGLSWLTIDDTVHLWTYNSSLNGTSSGATKAGESNQILDFQMPSKQPIVSVGLARPKPGKLESHFCAK